MDDCARGQSVARDERPMRLHIYSKGGHGFGMRRQNLPSDHWIDRLGEWLAL